MARILSVHAHPDDEASKGAPTIARYVAEGHEAALVCATGGEAGDIINPAMKSDEVAADLGAIRAEELRQSTLAIGYSTVVNLNYRDSGMPGSENNAHPECFAAADIDDATGRLVEIIREFRPDVLITYSDNQKGYEHPDHLRVHDISVLAFDRAADSEWYAELGDPWQASKLYYSMWSKARLVAHHALFQELGLESPYGPDWFERPAQDHRITTKIEVSDFYHLRGVALLAHRTQIDPNEPFWFGLPDDRAAAAYPYEDFILAKSLVDSQLPETDLFAGIDVPVSHV